LYIWLTYKVLPMKKTLLLNLIILFGLSVNAQSPIQKFYQPQDWISYSIVQSAVPLDQETSGANRNWNFSQLTEVGNSEVRTIAPTAEELAVYQHSTAVTVTTSTLGTEDFNNKIFSRTSGATVSITGANTSQIELIYDMDQATLGDFPLAYGYTNSDGISGTYNAEGGYTGDFNGNSTTAVDAYGTLTLNVGNVPAQTPVTRLKTTQNISLNYSFFTNVGTVTQTIYSYYRDDSSLSTPVFRSTHTNIRIPLMQVDYTTESLEVFQTQLLEIPEFKLNDLSIAPNPTADFIYIQNGNHDVIRSIKITDANGRSIMESNVMENKIDLSGIQKGVYFAQIKTDSETFTKKIVKK